MKNELVGVGFAWAFAAVAFCGFPAQCLRGEEAAPVAGAQGDFFCGPRCVQQALRHFGQRVELYDLVSESRYDGSAAGASMSELREMLARRGIHSLAVELPASVSKPWPGPMIAHLPPKSDGAIGHWVTVTPTAAAGEYSVFYGLRDTRVLGWKELVAATSGHAILTSKDPIVPAAVRASWPETRSYAPAAGGCVLLALAIGLLLAKRARRHDRRFLTRPRFALALAGVAAGVCYAILFPAVPRLRVLAASEIAALRGGAPSCGNPGCWASGPQQQCGTIYYDETCDEQLCPGDGDCSSEISIEVAFDTVDSVICANFPTYGKTAFVSQQVVCSWGNSCAATCSDPDPNGNRWCETGPGPMGPLSYDEMEDPNGGANNCTIPPVTYWRQENPHSRLWLIASVNGLNL